MLKSDHRELKNSKEKFMWWWLVGGGSGMERGVFPEGGYSLQATIIVTVLT